MTDGSYREGPGSRWTPDPRRIRQAAIGFVSAGLYVGLAGALLPLMAAHLTLSAAMATQWQGSMLIGGLIGALSGRWLARMPSGVRAVASGGVLATATALVWLAFVPGQERLAAAAVLMGLGIGLAGVASSYALDGVLLAGRAASALDLAAACFGFGAAGGCLAIILLRQWFTFDQVATTAAIALLAGALTIRLRSAPPDAVAPIVLTHHWHDVLSPTRALLSISLMLQAALWGATAYWLGFYASRSLGVTPTWSVGLLLVFWIGWSMGRTAAIRAVGPNPLKAAAIAVPLGSLGCLFLANTLSLSGAIAGALLLGAASGSLQGVVQNMASGQDVALAMLGRFFAGTVMMSLAAAALTGFLMQASGVDSVVWVIALTGAVLCLCLVVLAIESRLARSPAEV